MLRNHVDIAKATLEAAPGVDCRAKATFAASSGIASPVALRHRDIVCHTRTLPPREPPGTRRHSGDQAVQGRVSARATHQPFDRPSIHSPSRLLGAALVAAAAATPALAQDGAVTRPARELARLMLDDAMRRTVSDQVSGPHGAGDRRDAPGAAEPPALRGRVGGGGRHRQAVRRRHLPASRTEEITAAIYARHFSQAELAELVRFQSSDVGRRSTAARAADRDGDGAGHRRRDQAERRAVPRLLAELQREFPVLRTEQSP